MRTVVIVLLLVVMPGLLLAQDAGRASGEGAVWAFTTGQQFLVQRAQQATVTTKVDTRTRIVEIETVMAWRWQVVDVGDDGVLMKQTLESIRLESGAPGDVSGGRLSFDSAKKIYRNGISGTISKQHQPLVGLAGRFRMDFAGTVSDWQIDSGQEDRLKKLPEGSPIKDLLNARDMAQSLSASTSILQLENATADDSSATEVVFDFNQDAGFINSSQRTTLVEKSTQYRDLRVNTSTQVVTRFNMKEAQ